METTTLQRIREKAGRIIEPSILHQGRVLATRRWDSGNMVEIDCHFPEMNMTRWTAVPYIKFRIGALEFRDYSPSGWDADTSTCTLFIDISHSGAGAEWAAGLSAGSALRYLKIGTTHQRPASISGREKMVALGDQAGLGHILALEEMAGRENVTFFGAVLLNDRRDCEAFKKNFHRTAIRPVHRFDAYGYRSLWDWVMGEDISSGDHFYLSGSHKLVGSLRGKIRDGHMGSGGIKVQGFW